MSKLEHISGRPSGFDRGRESRSMEYNILKRVFVFSLTAVLGLSSLNVLRVEAQAAEAQTAKASAEKKNTQLRIGMTQEFEALNPLIAQMAASSYIYQAVGRGLVTIDENWKWVCVLCVSLPSLENGSAKLIKATGKDTKQKLEVSWVLREDAVWGDGQPITGEDIRFSWQVGSTAEISVANRESFTRIEDIRVDAKNPKKFTILFKEARYDFYQLGDFPVLPKHLEGKIFEASKKTNGLYEKQSLYNTNPTHHGLYSGPYRVAELKLGSHVVLVKNEKYAAQPKPSIDQVIFRYIPNTQTLEANLLSGSIDMISELGLSFDQALALEKRMERDAKLKSRYNVQFRQGMIYEHISLNLRSPKLQDLRVRKALLHGADRAKLVQALFESRQPVALHNIHPLDPYYTVAVETHAFDPAKAEALLDEAGWKKGPGGVRAKDGQLLELTLMTTAQNKSRETVQVFLQDQWKKIGVDVKIRNEPARVFFGETVRKGLYPDLAMFAWISSPDSPPRSTLHSAEIPTEKNGFAGQNSGAFSNAKLDKLFETIPFEFNFEKRKAMMAEVQSLYASELPALPLYLRAEIVVTPVALKGFQLTGHKYFSTQNIERWSVDSAALGVLTR